MAKEVGAEALGRFFTDGKVRSRREWRGFKDTFYDYTRWLYIMKQLAGFIIKPEIQSDVPLSLDGKLFSSTDDGR